MCIFGFSFMGLSIGALFGIIFFTIFGASVLSWGDDYFKNRR